MEPAEGALELAKSGLKIADGLLVKCTGDGKAVGRHRLEDVEDVGLERTWDEIGVGFLVVGLALAASPKFIAPPGLAAWGLLVVGIVLAFLGLVGSRKTLLVIRSAHGEVRYRVLDGVEDASGFAATLRALVEERRRSERSKWGQPG